MQWINFFSVFLENALSEEKELEFLNKYCMHSFDNLIFFSSFMRESTQYQASSKEVKKKLKDRFELIDEYGGYEGAGEEWHQIVKSNISQKYYKLIGCYYSHSGIDVNDYWFEVVPKEKTIIIYEEK